MTDIFTPEAKRIITSFLQRSQTDSEHAVNSDGNVRGHAGYVGVDSEALTAQLKEAGLIEQYDRSHFGWYMPTTQLKNLMGWKDVKPLVVTDMVRYVLEIYRMARVFRGAGTYLFFNATLVPGLFYSSDMRNIVKTLAQRGYIEFEDGTVDLETKEVEAYFSPSTSGVKYRTKLSDKGLRFLSSAEYKAAL